MEVLTHGAALGAGLEPQAGREVELRTGLGAGVEELDRIFTQHTGVDPALWEGRGRRAMPSLHLPRPPALRPCANMNGILGGSNAFNYISFVLGILTLVVNVNNNVNNNNNNNNQANVSIFNIRGGLC